MKDSGFKVVIVGGGIGGLALTNSLQHANIDFVLIEKGKVLDPQVGAAIGILPNGARLLDQIGCFDELARLTATMESTASHAEDGRLIGEVSDSLKLMERRTGYPVIFIDRQLLLRVLASHVIEPDQIRLETTVQAVDQHRDKAVVHCSDGTTIEADIVVGSDGVHSLVRREMWRHADLIDQGARFTEDKKAISAEYKCLFGISMNISGMEAGQTDRTYARGASTLSYVGKEGRVFWFVFIKMDQVYYPPHIPKFSKDDVTAVIDKIGTLPVRGGKVVTISDLYHSRITCNLVAIEEATFQHWSHDRLVCLGDAIHKMTPNLGAGASSAIESAAVLSNTIVSLARRSSKPPVSVIRAGFEEYQQARETRVRRAMGLTNKLTRVQALQTTKDYVFTHYIGPLMDDYYAEVFSSFVIGAPVIDHLPIPPRSLRGTMPFNPKQGWGFEEATSTRIRRAWPLLVVALLSLLRVVSFSSGQWSRFLPAVLHQHNAASNFAMSVQSDLIYGFWMLEQTRMNNQGTFASMPILSGVLTIWLGIEVSLPLHLFLMYIQSPIEKFRASDSRLTDVSYVYAIAPLVVFSAICQLMIHYRPSSSSSLFGQSVDTTLDWFTRTRYLSIGLFQFLFVQFVRPSTVRSDRISNVRRDVTGVRRTSEILATCSSFFWWWYVYPVVASTGSYSFTNSNGNGNGNNSSVITSWEKQRSFTASVFSHWEWVSLASAITVWLILALSDLRDAGMINISSWMILGPASILLIYCLGPVAVLLIGWRVREEVLLRRRHRHATVSTSRVK